MKLPVSRSENIVVQEAGKELLVYDLRINKAFCLNETSTIIYRFCDGVTSFEEVQRRTGFSEDVVHLALDQFKKDDLIEGEEIVFAGGLSRRAVIRKIGFTTMITLPLVSALIAPTAAEAASNCPVSCFFAPGGCCPAGQSCTGSQCCPPSNVCIVSCCSPNQSCVFGGCCPSSQVCGVGTCCAPGQVCQGFTNCCPSAQNCGFTCCPGGQTCRFGLCSNL